MFPDCWTFDLVFWRMVIHLCRMAFINKIIAPEGWTFVPLISISSVGTPLFYFISGVYIYWITNGQIFTKIWVQVLFGWNDLKWWLSVKHPLLKVPKYVPVIHCKLYHYLVVTSISGYSHQARTPEREGQGFSAPITFENYKSFWEKVLPPLWLTSQPPLPPPAPPAE